MKESGIIFNGGMVRAILSGQKTQTRRTLTPRHIKMIEAAAIAGECYPLESGHDHENSQAYYREWCPFGKVGDKLWVREACKAKELESGLDVVCYLADQAEIPIKAHPLDAGLWIDLYRYRGGKGMVVPSIHMPRWTSRITLEITDVRVERLNDISEVDAHAEGFTSTAQLTALGDDYTGLYASDRFADTWQSIYGAESWDANPWVWVIEFCRIEGD